MNVFATTNASPLIFPQAFECLALRRKPSLVQRISDVCQSSINEQVARPNTMRNVAMMANVKTAWNGLIVSKLPRIAVHPNRLVTANGSHLSVTGTSSSSPQPAMANVSKCVVDTNRPVFINFAPKLFFGSHGLIQRDWLFRVLPRSVADSTIGDSPFKKAEIANGKLMPATVGSNNRHTFGWFFAPIRAVAVTINNEVLRLSEFLRSFLRHDVDLSISDVVFSSGRTATTGAHCAIVT